MADWWESSPLSEKKTADDWYSSAPLVGGSAPTAPYQPGTTESAVRGVAQGLTLGWGDELTGLIAAGKTGKWTDEIPGVQFTRGVYEYLRKNPEARQRYAEQVAK